MADVDNTDGSTDDELRRAIDQALGDQLVAAVREAFESGAIAVILANAVPMILDAGYRLLAADYIASAERWHASLTTQAEALDPLIQGRVIVKSQEVLLIAQGVHDWLINRAKSARATPVTAEGIEKLLAELPLSYPTN